MTDRGDQQLPDILERIAQAAGEEAALLVAKAFGGQPFYVPLPTNLTGEHPLVELVGIERAKLICIELGHGQIRLPRGPFSSSAEARRKVIEMLGQRKTHAAIARETNMHVRAIEKIAARLREIDPDQGSLF